jgi:hypothetical protein
MTTFVTFASLRRRFWSRYARVRFWIKRRLCCTERTREADVFAGMVLAVVLVVLWLYSRL